ncbi:MAG TPA: hypothetical protein VGH33_26850 [Isosphaeraceae bacterium]|jgi:hypothetical protein
MFVPIKDPVVFLGASALVVAYLLYTMIRKRKGLRAGYEKSEPEL